MALSENGFEARRFTDIREQIFNEMVSNLAIQLDTSPNQILSIITNIFASSVTDVEELAQAVADNFNIDKAEGKYLDDLVALIKLKRLDESFSTGILHFKTTSNSSTIPVNSVFSDTNGFTYFNPVDIPVSNLSCTEIILTPNTTSGLFSVIVNGVEYSVNYQNPTAAAGVVQGLRDSILSTVPQDFTVFNDTATTLKIASVDKSIALSVVPNSRLNILELECFGNIRSTQTGQLDPEIGSISTSVNTITGLQSVNNYFRLSVGRNKETDEELRARHARSTQISGSSTASALFSKLSNLVGVSQVRVFENKTTLTDINGLPPKSFECIVEGGIEQEIAETIYSTMPISSETYGEITTVVKDYSGNNEAVKWSRPTKVFVNVRVTFSLYAEEEFPDDGIQSIKNAVLDYGNSLTLDQDVIPQRFLGVIYNSVRGIGTMTVQVGKSLNPTSASPDDVPYSSNPLPINTRSVADFDEIRIQIIQQ